MAPSRYDWKIVDWDVKPQHNQPTNRLGSLPRNSVDRLTDHARNDLIVLKSHRTLNQSGCDRELNAHFYSAASLKYHVPDTWHDTTPSHIILTLGRPVLALRLSTQ